MAENEGFDGDALTGRSFSQLLESGDFEGLDIGGSYIHPSSFPSGEMLCFGDVCIEGERGFSEAGRLTGRLSGITRIYSSSASSSNNSSSNRSSKLNRGVGDEAVNQLQKSVNSKLQATVARKIQTDVPSFCKK